MRRGRQTVTVACPSWTGDMIECGRPIVVSLIVRNGREWDLEEWDTPCHGNSDEGSVDALMERAFAALQLTDYYEEGGES